MVAQAVANWGSAPWLLLGGRCPVAKPQLKLGSCSLIIYKHSRTLLVPQPTIEIKPKFTSQLTVAPRAIAAADILQYATSFTVMHPTTAVELCLRIVCVCVAACVCARASRTRKAARAFVCCGVHARVHHRLLAAAAARSSLVSTGMPDSCSCCVLARDAAERQRVLLPNLHPCAHCTPQPEASGSLVPRLNVAAAAKAKEATTATLEAETTTVDVVANTAPAPAGSG